MLFIPAKSTPLRQPVSPEARTSKDARGSGQVILYIDEHRWLMPLVERLLTEHGFEVRAFAEAEALREALKGPLDTVDIVIAEYPLRGLSCLEITRSIKSIRPELPVMLVADPVSEALLEEIQGCGADAILFKPTLLHDLIPCIERLLGTAAILSSVS
jgi:DNA-binding response OmpR family regulator